MSAASAGNTRNRRDEQADATRAALIASARRLFTEQGYAATGTGAIVTDARVGTRGALYHHFPDKEALFAAVFEAVQADLGRAVVARVDADPHDPLGTLRATIVAFLECLLEQPDAQAVFREGPVAMGWAAFRADEVRYATGAIEALLTSAAEQGTLIDAPIGPLARTLVAALDEAALALATADDQDAVRVEWSTTLAALVDALAV